MKKIFIYIIFLIVSLQNLQSFGQSSTLIKDLNLGVGDGFDNWNFKGVQYKDNYLLPAKNGNDNLELYTIKNGDISLIKDINPAGSSNPENFVLLKDKIYFIATNDANGREIWSTDGTAEGTTLAIDVLPGKESGNPDKLIVSKNDKLYFSSNNKVYVSDGTQSGTKEILGFKRVNFKEDFITATPTAVATYKQGIAFVNKNEKVYQIFYHDGATLTKLHEFTNDYFTRVNGLLEVSAGLLFNVNDSFTSDFNGVFTIDKNSNQVSRVLNKENKPLVTRTLIKLNDEKSIIYTDKALYISNGLNSGTTELITNGSSSLFVGDIMNHIIINGKMLIRAGGGFLSDYMYITDGTIAGTTKIAECKTYQSPMISSGTKAYWFAGIENGFDVEMWEADLALGTAKQINFLKVNKYTSTSAYPIYVEKNILYYNSILFGDGRELYKLNKDLNYVNASLDADNTYKLSQSAENVFTIHTIHENENFNIIHYDLAGKNLKTITTSSNQNFELNLSDGVSFIEVKGKSNRNIFRILKK